MSPTGHRAAVLTAGALTVLVLGGCAGQEQSGAPAQRVSTWLGAGAGGAGVGNVEVDSRNVDLALAQHNKPAAIKEVCALLSNDAQSAVGNLPSPDQQLTDALDAAYTAASAAGDDCYRGASGDARSLARSSAERAKLPSLFAVAVRRIVAVTGRTPTTETTVPPTGGGDPFSGGQ